MTRKKVKLVWIGNDAARKASLKKRRIGLLKKVSELTTLCGVSAFCIIYSPEENEPMLWPSRPVVEQLLMRYQSMPEIERCKKMMNQESYLKERIGKIQEQSKKHLRKNREFEMSYLMDKLHHSTNGIDDLEVSEVQVLIWLMEERMKDLRKRVEYFQQVPPLLPPGSFPPPPPSQEHPIMDEMVLQGGGGGGGGDMRNTPTDAMTWDQWFFDMINNNENLGGCSSGTKNEMVLHPHGYNLIPGISGGGVDMGMGFHPAGLGGADDGNIIGMGGMGLPPQANMMNMAGNAFDLGLQRPPHGNIITGSSSENMMGLGLQFPGSTDLAGADIGTPGFIPGGSDIGLPYDVTKPWPHSFSP